MPNLTSNQKQVDSSMPWSFNDLMEFELLKRYTYSKLKEKEEIAKYYIELEHMAYIVGYHPCSIIGIEE